MGAKDEISRGSTLELQEALLTQRPRLFHERLPLHRRMGKKNNTYPMNVIIVAERERLRKFPRSIDDIIAVSSKEKGHEYLDLQLGHLHPRARMATCSNTFSVMLPTDIWQIVYSPTPHPKNAYGCFLCSSLLPENRSGSKAIGFV